MCPKSIYRISPFLLCLVCMIYSRVCWAERILVRYKLEFILNISRIFLRIRCDQTWEHTKGNTDVFMWLELYILWNIFPSNFIKFIFSLAPDHKLVQCWPNLNMAFANHGWSTGGIHTTQTNRDISKLQAESYTQSGK